MQILVFVNTSQGQYKWENQEGNLASAPYVEKCVAENPITGKKMKNDY